MKHLLWGSAAALLLSVVACKKNDPQLAAQVQEQIAVADSAATRSAEATGKIDALIAQMEQVPAELKTDTVSGFPLAYHKMVTFKPKHDAVRGDQQQVTERLRSLSANIAAGKISPEEAKIEFEIAQEILKKITARADGYARFNEEMSAEFAKIMATYKAKTEN